MSLQSREAAEKGEGEIRRLDEPACAAQLSPSEASAGASAAAPGKRGGAGDTAMQPWPGQQNDLMLIRVCVTVDALFPTSVYALPIDYDAQGGYALAVASVYVNEPS